MLFPSGNIIPVYTSLTEKFKLDQRLIFSLFFLIQIDPDKGSLQRKDKKAPSTNHIKHSVTIFCDKLEHLTITNISNLV